MAIEIFNFAHLTCDKCGAEIYINFIGGGTDSDCESASKNGWILLDHKVLCPSHSDAPKDGSDGFRLTTSAEPFDWR